MKPSLPKGTRDFGTVASAKRAFIFDTIKDVFRKSGYQKIETPAMESLSTLTGKYGEEGDRLLFKVLNNGDFLSKANPQALEEKNSQKLVPSIAKRGLRYDLTVPFARFVVMHQNDLSFPFKRYQIQPVWRADRPQKGRYQEFYQCDADVVGSRSLFYEAEFITIYDQVFKALDIPVKIKLNNRKVLQGIAEASGLEDNFHAMTVAIDKLDKIGIDGVLNEFLKSGIEEQKAQSAIEAIQLNDLDSIRAYTQASEVGQEGIKELEEVLQYLAQAEGLHNELQLDWTLARGLNYYTGCILEVQAIGVNIGSIGGGGRYANLTEVFGLKDISGVGISFGAERIYDVMEELELFPETINQSLKVLIIAMNTDCHLRGYSLLNKLRSAGISSDLYPDPVKMKKQMKYANAIRVPYVIIIGETELMSENFVLKNMISGEEGQKSENELVSLLI